MPLQSTHFDFSPLRPNFVRLSNCPGKLPTDCGSLGLVTHGSGAGFEKTLARREVRHDFCFDLQTLGRQKIKILHGYTFLMKKIKKCSIAL
jgi:hypothetical protein